MLTIPLPSIFVSAFAPALALPCLCGTSTEPRHLLFYPAFTRPDQLKDCIGIGCRYSLCFSSKCSLRTLVQLYSREPQRHGRASARYLRSDQHHLDRGVCGADSATQSPGNDENEVVA